MVVIGRYAHSGSEGACVMEWVSLVAGRRAVQAGVVSPDWWRSGKTSFPTCTSRAVSSAAQAVNDALGDGDRAGLAVLLPGLLGAKRCGAVEAEFRVSLRLGCWAIRSVLELGPDWERGDLADGISVVERWLVSEDPAAAEQCAELSEALWWVVSQTPRDRVLQDLFEAVFEAADAVATATGQSRVWEGRPPANGDLEASLTSAVVAVMASANAACFEVRHGGDVSAAERLVGWLNDLIEAHAKALAAVGEVVEDPAADHLLAEEIEAVVHALCATTEARGVAG